MGCCEHRDEDSKREEKKGRAKALKAFSFSQMQDQDFVVVPDHSPLSRQLNVHNNSESLRLYIEWCKSLKKWNEIVEFIGDFTELSETYQFIKDTSPPQSISALVVVYLFLELKKNQEVVYKYIDSSIFNIIRILNKSSDDFIENSLLLIRDFMKVTTDEALEELIKFGIFEVMHNILYGRTTSIGYTVLQIFYIGVKRSELAKKNFCVNGLNDLNEILSNKSKKYERSVILASKIINSVVSSNHSENNFESKIRESQVFQLIKTEHITNFSDKNREKVQEFIKKLDN